jgi:hypothetical protein
MGGYIQTSFKESVNWIHVVQFRDQWRNLVSTIMNLVENKAVPLHAIEALMGRGGIAPTYSRYRHYIASRPGRALPPGKGPPVPIVQEAGWASEPVWTQRLEEKYFRLCR